MPVVEPVKKGLSAGSDATATAPGGRLASVASVIDHAGGATHDRSHREATAAPPAQDTAPVPAHLVGCRASCAFGEATERHHRRLKAIEHDPEAVLELMELAITWTELEYSEADTIPPEDWRAFVDSHRWADLDHVERIFRLATDIVRAATRPSVGQRTGRGRAAQNEKARLASPRVRPSLLLPRLDSNQQPSG
jgi:hypothetical protein